MEIQQPVPASSRLPLALAAPKPWHNRIRVDFSSPVPARNWGTPQFVCNGNPEQLSPLFSACAIPRTAFQHLLPNPNLILVSKRRLPLIENVALSKLSQTRLQSYSIEPHHSHTSPTLAQWIFPTFCTFRDLTAQPGAHFVGHLCE